MWMRDKSLLLLAGIVIVIVIGALSLLSTTEDLEECGVVDTITDNFGSCGIVDNKIWYFTDNGTYVEYWGNTSSENWSAIIADRDRMQAYVESEIERYNAAVRDSGRYEITLVTKE
jgi:hypothetical protein